jgi:phosphoglycolate phosphatase
MKKILITDVDNTLFDWQRLWYETFSAMSSVAIEISGIKPDVFFAECSALHQQHGTSEYSFVLTELPSFKAKYGEHVRAAMQPAIEAFRKARDANLKLYDGVALALDELKSKGIIVAAFTESKAFYTSERFRSLGLDGRIDFLYSPKDHDLPADKQSDYLKLNYTKHRLTPDGESKPNPHLLISIVEELGFELGEAVYVGDNLLKDVYMAQSAKILDVHAEYGAAQHRAIEYDLLKRVTHWTPDMVAREREALKPGAVTPSHSLKKSFSEIVSIMEAVDGDY